MLTLNIIGPGRLGKSIARLATTHYQIAGVCASTLANSREAVAFIGAGQACATLADLPRADLFLLSVPDGLIAEKAKELAACGVVQAGNVVFHASGVSEASLLLPLKAAGASIASLHPAFSFADPARAVSTFADTLCALEGDAKACEVLHDFARALGGKPFYLAEGGKAAYHASLSMAANYLVTLADLSVKTAGQAGISEEIAQLLIHNLMQQTLGNIKKLGPAAALTGPIVRGDQGTIDKHLSVLNDINIRHCYQSLGLATINLAGDRLSAVQQLALSQRLS
ncbi:Rossmann-like and DUF2520 domain-containing protein [Iodobacter fluviatilis]|uniref:Short-subunit dehydrogenase-like oxidoreductase (DUF2520 family) n=1 Tax=Iodobacter fluviatilis TaxID=537 RepID=A0A377SWE8_9NEIS|nr:Rossmann-like and DUF2520 domain-containing protein [Iodobacter fluviatilis]TCU88139.1 putative short-subunit dehydrogenase-like oxidoreductase (DUF2520 family) [Iodobacter fluviatilis]STR45640.1 Uncharacterized conserved protein [Iodobacter fluviatilis]